MSDGNFNRSLIPNNSYQSGVRAGEARMRQQAIIALEEILSNDFFATLPTKEKETILHIFKEKLNKSIK